MGSQLFHPGRIRREGAKGGVMMTLGDRVKRYEQPFRNYAVHRMPLIIRVDGRAFHTFTRRMDKPFDKPLMRSMVLAALDVATDMQGFKVGYVQSDEATFCLTDYDTITTEGWLDYNISKVVSLSASLMSVAFNKHMGTYEPIFDSRAFSVPADDVANVFLWRAKDWQRNSLQMYCRAFFSHKELHLKNREAMHEMLHSIGKNWSIDLTDQEKNGTFIFSTDNGLTTRSDILPDYNSINQAMPEVLVVLGREK